MDTYMLQEKSSYIFSLKTRVLDKKFQNILGCTEGGDTLPQWPLVGEEVNRWQKRKPTSISLSLFLFLSLH